MKKGKGREPFCCIELRKGSALTGCPFDFSGSREGT
jgi:hypothetical protein